MLKLKNMFTDIPSELPEEFLETLSANNNIKIERIVSKGHKSPQNFWYDQDQNEFVLLLQGKAKLQFEDETVSLNAGDCLNIPSHRKHRVEWTEPNTATIWLAVYY